MGGLGSGKGKPGGKQGFASSSNRYAATPYSWWGAGDFHLWEEQTDAEWWQREQNPSASSWGPAWQRGWDESWEEAAPSHAAGTHKGRGKAAPPQKGQVPRGTSRGKPSGPARQRYARQRGAGAASAAAALSEDEMQQPAARRWPELQRWAENTQGVSHEEEVVPWYYLCDGEMLRCRYPYNLAFGWPETGPDSMRIIQEEAATENIRINLRARGRGHTNVMIILGPPGTTRAWYSRVRAATKVRHPDATLPKVHSVWMVPVRQGVLNPHENMEPSGDTEESSASSVEEDRNTKPSEDRVRRLKKVAGVPPPPPGDPDQPQQGEPFLLPESSMPPTWQGSTPFVATEHKAGAEAAPASGAAASSGDYGLRPKRRAEAAPARRFAEEGAEETMQVESEDEEVEPPDAVPRERAKNPVNPKVARMYEAALDAFKAPVLRLFLVFNAYQHMHVHPCHYVVIVNVCVYLENICCVLVDLTSSRNNAQQTMRLLH